MSDEAKWLRVHEHLQRATTSHEADDLDEAFGWLLDAVYLLYGLLEPPSAREARQHEPEVPSPDIIWPPSPGTTI